MFISKCMFLCLCYVMLGCHVNSVPFIDKCKWDDNACMVTSAHNALPYFAAGLPEFGVPPLDPLKLDQVEYNEGGLKLVFKDSSVTGPKLCKILDIEVIFGNISRLSIHVQGTYEAFGNLYNILFEGNGPFTVKTDKLHVTVKVHLTTVDGEDGHKHWKISKPENTYEPIEKVHLEFTNLFNGDPEKTELTDAVQKIIQQNSKELVLSIGKPVVTEVLDKVVSAIQIFALKVPADQLEL